MIAQGTQAGIDTSYCVIFQASDASELSWEFNFTEVSKNEWREDVDRGMCLKIVDLYNNLHYSVVFLKFYVYIILQYSTAILLLVVSDVYWLFIRFFKTYPH